jgi:hypothetical protein
MNKGEFFTRFFIWVTLAGYFIGSALLALSLRKPSLDSRARLIWTIACISLLVHVACAYHFYHDWSQELAYRDTARQTAEVAGFDWGGGLYINYLLMAGWVLDVAWWWRAPGYYRSRPLMLTVAWHAFLMFMIFNATVVFETGALRVVGVILSLALCVLWGYSVAGIRSRSRTRLSSDIRNN